MKIVTKFFAKNINKKKNDSSNSVWVVSSHILLKYCIYNFPVGPTTLLLLFYNFKVVTITLYFMQRMVTSVDKRGQGLLTH